MELTNTILEFKTVEPLVCVTKYYLKSKKKTHFNLRRNK